MEKQQPMPLREEYPSLAKPFGARSDVHWVAAARRAASRHTQGALGFDCATEKVPRHRQHRPAREQVVLSAAQTEAPFAAFLGAARRKKEQLAEIHCDGTRGGTTTARAALQQARWQAAKLQPTAR